MTVMLLDTDGHLTSGPDDLIPLGEGLLLCPECTGLLTFDPAAWEATGALRCVPCQMWWGAVDDEADATPWVTDAELQ